MIAALPMYDRAETAAAWDRLWVGIRDRLRAAGQPAPEALARGGDLMEQWLAPDLVLSQTCGLPFRARLHGRVTLVGTPDFAVAGCAPGYYRSVLVARAGDGRAGLAAFAGARLAYNDALSQSGWAAVQAPAAESGVALRPVGPTGSHRASAQAVAAGEADLAAIDAVTWRMLERWEPVAVGLRVVALTAPTPGLPLIAARGADAPRLFGAVAGAIAAMPAADRSLTGLAGLVAIPAQDYLALPVPPLPAPGVAPG